MVVSGVRLLPKSLTLQSCFKELEILQWSHFVKYLPDIN